ncbi:MAG: hypothetical protein O7J95_09905 [Planctomycetota bacterium]|nr:hypothetical protein [Planctomycetota bacterium]
MAHSSVLRGRLPELYRSRGGEFLDNYLAIAEELLDTLREPGDAWRTRCREVFEEFLLGDSDSSPSLPEASRLAGAPRPGTAFWLASWARAWRESQPSGRRGGADQPWVWPALSVVEDGDGGLLFSRTWARAVVLAWSPGGMAKPSAGFRLPLDLFPADCDVRGVWLERAPRRNPPLPGSRLGGVILTAHGSGGEK